MSKHTVKINISCYNLRSTRALFPGDWVEEGNGVSRPYKGPQAIRCPIRSCHSSSQSAPKLKSCGLKMQSRSSACSSGKKKKKVHIKQLFRKLQTTSVISLAIQTNLGPRILKAQCPGGSSTHWHSWSMSWSVLKEAEHVNSIASLSHTQPLGHSWGLKKNEWGLTKQGGIPSSFAHKVLLKPVLSSLSSHRGSTSFQGQRNLSGKWHLQEIGNLILKH